MSVGPKVKAWAIVATLLLLASACGQCGTGSAPGATGSPEPPAGRATDVPPSRSPAPTQTPTPRTLNTPALLEASGEVMAALNTFHFVLSHEGGSTQLFPGLVIEEARGDVDSPDKLAVEFAGVFGEGYAVKSGLITIGESTYMVNPLTGEWEAATTGITPLGFFNPRLGISSIMSRLRQPQLLVNGEGDGEAHRLGGDLPADALAPLLGDTLADATVRVELTIDAQGSYLLEARVAGPVTPTDLPEVVRVITLSGFNEPVAIEPPIE